jgi:hypothetical protein
MEPRKYNRLRYDDFVLTRKSYICARYTHSISLHSSQVNDPTKCGALRVYFDYDKDFPDDDRICEEVRELQVRTLMFFRCFVEYHLTF